MHSVSETVAHVLAPRVNTYFGIMGNGNAFFVNALEQLNMGIIPVRHEVGTVAAADAYHRVTGKLAVATTTYGPGFTNTITALVESAKARVPLILVTGTGPTSNDRPWDIDQAALAATFAVQTFTVTPTDAAATTVDAFEHAITHRTPVVIEIPYDLAVLETTDPYLQDSIASPSTQPEPAATAPSPTAINEIAQLLSQAEQPLILAGRGGKQAAGQLNQLAELLHADVATTAPTRGLFGTSEHYRNLGICGGFAAPEAAPEIHKADVVLVVGAGLNQFTMAFGSAFREDAHVIQVDLAESPTNARVNQHVEGGATQAVAGIIEALTDQGFVASRRIQPENLTQRPQGDPLAPDGRLDPRSLLYRINKALPRERIIATDGGHFIGWANTYLDVPAPDHMVLLGTATQSIGLGFQTAVGVAAAAGTDKMSVLVTGDGGGLMAIADAESFVRQANRGVIIVINDAAYGAEIHQYGSKGLAEAPMLIPEVNFAGLLSAVGARSQIVRGLDDLADFEAWVATGKSGTYALDCRVSRDIIAPYMQEMIR
ncbi:thiamine pyrophosphate-binding protein [Corynebacterium lubricantis]|uniref:thiamine pyrophosphate-binding protein n=1 Tax=Corynebacterium lubricantis TaxID=541095 RepID=UPI0003710FF0|nr:thiamine pyrophosphate-binding protein [Corynebacterium lubricantis]